MHITYIYLLLFDSYEKKEEMDMTYLVSNDRVDRHGKIADKRTTGGWKAAPFIIGTYEMSLGLLHLSINYITMRSLIDNIDIFQ
jgi:hypothetical protein